MFWGLIPSFAKEFKQHPKHRLDLTRVEVFYDDKDNFRKDLLKTKKDGWRDNRIKTREVKYAIKEVLDSYRVKEPDAEYVLKLVKNQRDY